MWILIKDKIPVGIFWTEQEAKAAMAEGDYFLIPIDTNRLYDSIIDMGLPGAIAYTKSGINSYVENLTAEIDDLKALLLEKDNQITALDERIKTIESKDIVLET